MKKLLIVLFFISSISFSQVKVFVAASGTIGNEPHLIESFIAGYESEGGNWTGIIRYSENTSMTTALPICLDSGYNLVLRNTGVSGYNSVTVDSFYNHGIQIVTCAGSNNYHAFRTNNMNLTNIIIAGDGATENMGGYPCEFYGTHPFNNFPITSATRGTGDTLTLVVNTSVNGVFYVTPSYVVNFSGVTGFSNSPIGLKAVAKQVANYNSFSIIHNPGTGSFVSGNVQVFYQSYSHAYIAGQIAYVKNSRNCSWWEARYCCRFTASENCVFDIFNGYGRINVLNAISYGGFIPPDPSDSFANINIPQKFILKQNYPNPFNPSTKISFEIPKPGLVSLKVYDIAGKVVDIILTEFRAAGIYNLNFNAGHLSSGIYFYTLSADGFTQTKIMTLLK